MVPSCFPCLRDKVFVEVKSNQAMQTFVKEDKSYICSTLHEASPSQLLQHWCNMRESGVVVEDYRAAHC